MGRGKFITFEGGEGSGKSTQIARLSKRLEKSGIPVKITREPGGSKGAEEIRKLLVTGDPERWDGLTEALLHFAARRDHVETIIKPCLENGQWVLCDRFADSTYAYQGIVQGVGKETIDSLYQITLGDFKPDLTFLLGISAEKGLARAKGREDSEIGNGEIRYERMGLEFHKKLEKAYMTIRTMFPDRIVKIPAELKIEEVEDNIWQLVQQRLKV